MKRIVLSVVALVIISVSAYAQFNLGAEFRPRFEFRDSYKVLPPTFGQIPAFQISQRTRLNVGFKWSIVNTYLSFQDVRLWGDEAMKTDVAGLGLYQGWAEIKVCDSLFIKAGRQEFAYDNERLFTPSNWSQKGLTHDALLLKYNHRGFSVDVAAAFNQSKDTTNSTDYNTALGNYKALSFAWLKYQFNRHFALQGVFIADGYQKKTDAKVIYARATSGGVFNFMSKYVNTDARCFYQFGQDQSGAKIYAYYINADVTVKPIKWFTIFTGTEFFSGNDMTDATNKNLNAFNYLYGSGHRYNGNIDFFTKPSDTKNLGLTDIYMDFIFLLKQKYQLRADFHYFRTEYNYIQNFIRANPYLGCEADITAKIPIVKDVDVQVGYSLFRSSQMLQVMQGNNKKKMSQWAFVMLTVKPTLFTWDGNKK